jgi:hypothetical protein
MASTSTVRRRRDDTLRCASAASARMPPSPRLSARMITVAYLSVTTTSSAQKIKERTPRTPASVSGRAPVWPNASRIV